jgi:hypothetical protein
VTTPDPSGLPFPEPTPPTPPGDAGTADQASLWQAPEANLPAPVAPVGPPPSFDLTIGDIAIAGNQLVTPNGVAPLRGSQWIVIDNTTTSQKIPAYAIILAIVFALACLLGLLFLLIKETVTTGYVNVTVRSGDLLHTTQIPVSNAAGVAQVRAAVSQAQTLAAMAA